MKQEFKLVDVNSPEFEIRVKEIMSKISPIKHDRFIALPDGWVRDLQEKLEWGPSSKDYMKFAPAEEYCTNLGGRLPTRKELQSLVDYNKYSPAINTDFFKDTKSEYYWTSDSVANQPYARWVVDFDNGGVYWNRESSFCAARPVRPCQC